MARVNAFQSPKNYHESSGHNYHPISDLVLVCAFLISQGVLLCLYLNETDVATSAPKRLRSYPPPPSAKSACAHPVSEIEASQIKALDPTGARTRLFDYKNPDGAKVGDTLLATFKTGDPFAGIILSIKSRGVDTSVLLRNQLTRIGTEMSIKIYSPSVLSMEIAARTEKRKRRARLYYMRKPKHDVGSVQRAVDQYLRKKAALTGGRLGAEYGQMRAKGKKR